jgi:glycine cleavage system T protein (aminomethyltransferase)
MKKTRFYNVHKELGAKIIEYAGFEMPVQYSSIIAEHKAVRNSVGVFDVSHMGEVFISGDKALDFVQEITINDASKLFPGRVQYSAMCYPDGGIVDDLLVYRLGEKEFMLVINAANTDKDFKWMNGNNKVGAKLENLSDEYSLLAVQGPNSKSVMKKLTNADLDKLEYYYFIIAEVAGINMILSRTGYTGELGYELYFKGNEKQAEELWTKIFNAGKEFNILPIGLAARDSLRLEKGYCLYGNDIDQTTNPLEAGLGWITKLDKENFIGKVALLKIKSEGLKRKLSGMISTEKVFPRHGYEIDSNGKKIGNVTSGTVSPVLEKPIALGYLETNYSSPGTKIEISIREKKVSCEVVKLPFVEN